MPGDFFLSDLQHLFKPDELGVAGLITSGFRGGEVVNGHFAEPFSGSFGVSSTTPEFTVRSADIVDVRSGDMIEVCETVYRIDSIEPGDAGISRLSLATVSQ